ncbi:hypothetical protein SAMN05421823_107101 [Catalinimonas alkaloidigena]|uniref:Arc-like DNA binding domain-containing protein n=1 Tax=Catalinimonas alkaloidigena TaxID=1075417 RepID=A0A1G9LMV0_9BACT|nr:Arc family DNA-binding protein [Catalinimonas alkaloidigena]SDL63183.1 hypothetical protein SAMN05421823_107101 [Catalinimonas alkaloidigena]
MAKKKAFVLRLSPEMMEAVEHWAADEFRSTNGQLEWIVDRALREAGRKYKKADPPSSGASPDTSNSGS